MFRLAVLGASYCVVTVGLTFLPWWPPLSRLLILPAALIFILCFLAAYVVTFKKGMRGAGSQMKHLMSLVPSSVRVVGLAVVVGLFLVMMLTPHRSGDDVVDVHSVAHGASGPDAAIGQAENQRQRSGPAFLVRAGSLRCPGSCSPGPAGTSRRGIGESHPCSESPLSWNVMDEG